MCSCAESVLDYEPEIAFMNTDDRLVPWGDEYERGEYEIIGVKLRAYTYSRDTITFVVRALP